MDPGLVELRKVRLGRGAIIAGEDDDGVVRLAGFVQRLHDFANGPVCFDQKIGVFADAGDAVELAPRRDRRVRRRHWEIKEEWLLLALPAANIIRAAFAVLE